MAERMRDDELAAVLADIGDRLMYPRSPLAPRVIARLRAPRPRQPWWRSRPLVPALATLALLLVVVALASPEVRAAARDILRIGGIDIFPAPARSGSPSPSRSPSASPSVQFPGTPTTLDVARRSVPFAVRVPDASALGEPDMVLLDTGAVTHVTLVYRERPGIPASPVAGVAMLVVEFQGGVDQSSFGKSVGPDTKLVPVQVNGAPGYWLEGAPHFFFYRDAAGSFRDETLRLAGNTLIWVDGGVTYRLEAQVSREEALRIAASFR